MFARHPATIRKLIWPSRRANAFRNLPDGEAAKLEEAPDGEAAKLEEAQQQAEHEEWHEAWRTVVRRFISRLELLVTRTHPSDGHSERSACITSTRAARAAGSTDAITATAISTNAETNTGNAPGILTSRKYVPAKRASTNPNAAPARTPAAAITVPSAITPLRSCCGSDPRASRIPNSRVRALTENASTPATPTTAIAKHQRV